MPYSNRLNGILIRNKEDKQNLILWLVHIDVWKEADPQKIINLITDDIKPYVCADPFLVVHKYGVFLTVSFC